MSKQTTLAIDFGTSRTKVAYFDEDQNKPVLVDIGCNIRTMIPSTFYVSQPVDGKIDEVEILRLAETIKRLLQTLHTKISIYRIGNTPTQNHTVERQLLRRRH